jgi:hypothetical protein
LSRFIRYEKYVINGKTYTRQYGGYEVKVLYEKMRGAACGWWNAETDGQLTFEEFNGLWIRHEGNRTACEPSIQRRDFSANKVSR